MRASKINAYRQMFLRIQLQYATPVEDRNSHPIEPWRRISRKITDDIAKAHETSVGLRKQSKVSQPVSYFASKLSLGRMAAIDERGPFIADKPVDLALKGKHQIRPFLGMKILVVNKARPKTGVVA